ncbi:MAG: hypothetical protein KKC46_11675 [Proteobacteria bacterium]|nr:hypothetical protein [Pseudomonadota bacterium]
MRNKIKIVTGLLVVTIALGGLWYAPKYLVYADKPVKSDAIVLFIGSESDNKARKKEVDLIIRQGFTTLLLIPAYRQILDTSATSFSTKLETSRQPPFLPGLKFKSYYEDTHIETLIAKKIMDKYGLESAIFVSSPFHLRRIKLITEKVFGKKSSKIVFVPTRFETSHNKIWQYSASDWKNLGSEYIKIAWFLMYHQIAAY